MATEITSAELPASQEITFIREIAKGPKRTLLNPVGTPNPLNAAVLAVLTVAAILFFTHTLGFGQYTFGTQQINILTDPIKANAKAPGLQIRFNASIVFPLLLLVLGAIGLLPPILRHPAKLRSGNTLAPIILLGLVILFFLLKIVDLGVFDYTFDALDIGAIVGLIFLGGILAMAVRGSFLAVLVFGGFFLWWGFSVTAGGDNNVFGFITLHDLVTSENGGRLLRALVPPKWSYLSEVIDPMLLTIQTAVISTIIGVTLALPLSILAARNTSPHPLVYTVVRFFINTVRSIPALVLALLFIPFVGLGPAAGILGLGIHSMSVLTKLYAESFETVKPQPIEALRSAGADGFKAFRWGVFPQAFPLVAGYSIYTSESNTRDATVVAFAGGGGIGLLLQANINLIEYANVSVMLIVIIVTVSLYDRFSDYIRSKIL